MSPKPIQIHTKNNPFQHVEALRRSRTKRHQCRCWWFTFLDDDQANIDGHYDRPPFDYEQVFPRVQRPEARLVEICSGWDV